MQNHPFKGHTVQRPKKGSPGPCIGPSAWRCARGPFVPRATRGMQPVKNPVRGGRFLNPNAACHQGDGWMLLVRLLKKLACRTDALQWGRSQMPVHGQTTVGMAGKRQASISLSLFIQREAMEHLKTKGLHGLTGTPQPGGETLWFPHLFRQGAIDAIVTSNYVHLFC